MKVHQFVSMLVLAASTLCSTAYAQSNPPAKSPEHAPATSAQPAPARLSSESTMGELLDDPISKAVLIKHFKEVAESEQIEMARGMSMRSLQSFAPDRFTDKSLDDFDADLANELVKAKR